MASTFNTGYSYNTTKLIKKAKKDKFKVQPAEFIYVTNKRGRKVKKKNPKWVAEQNRRKNIDKDVDKYVSDRKVKINKDLTKDNSKKNKKSNEVKNKEVKNEKIVNNKKDNKENKSTTKGGPVKSGVEYARSKGDDLAGYRRGPNKALGKDTRITKHLKSKGWTEDRLAAKRKAHAEWKANRKKKKNKLKIGG